MSRPLYFASGSSAPGDIRGFARIGHPIGVSLPELSETALVELERLKGRGIPVMIDSGAFSEVEMGPAGPVVARPIDEQGWAWRMATYRRLARALGSQAYCVAPDRVGDQDETLRRLSRWARHVRKLQRLDAQVIVPIQRGTRSAADFDRAVVATLGTDAFIRAIPGNKVAMPPAELETYLKRARPRAIHVLGCGPRNARFVALGDVLRRLAPEAAVSCDSNLLAAHVGRENGRGGAPRLLTAYQRPDLPGACTPWQNADGSPIDPLSREQAIVFAFGPPFWFQRMQDDLRTRGIVIRGFERVDDGLEAKGFELHHERPLQYSLFDEVSL